MSKDIEIMQGGTPMSFSDITKVVTVIQAGNAGWIPDDETGLAEISITSNGQYVASGYGYYGFIKVNVNVAGGTGSEMSPALGGVGQINAGAIDLNDVYVNAPAGGIGSSLMGIDPTTGEWVTMRIDPNGNVTREEVKLPKSIRVLIPPAKTSYSEGEKIDYMGMVIELLDEDGNTFKNDLYPTGTITYSPTPYLGIDSQPYLNLNIDTPTENASFGTMEVQVSWTSPYDNAVLEASFRISPKEDEGNSDGFSGSGGGDF